MEFEEFIGEWRNAVPHILAKTSGSTGNPKIIQLPKDFVRRSAERTNGYFGICKESRLHSCVAADYIGGKMMAVRADIANCRLTWESPSNRPLSNLDKEEKIDLLAVVPSQMIHILDNLTEMPHIKAVIIGGSAINPLLYERIIASGINAYETYGMTETSSHIALRKVAADSEWFETLGGITVATDERGCLLIKFDSGESFQTNDLAELNGIHHFKINGRYDHMIITGGKKVNPFEIEKKLAPYIPAPFMVTSRPDLKWGRAVVLKIEAGEEEHNDEYGWGGQANLELQSRIRSVLEPHEVPKFVEYVMSLPRTENGKIKR